VTGSNPTDRDCPSPASFHENTTFRFRQTDAPAPAAQSNSPRVGFAETPIPR